MNPQPDPPPEPNPPPNPPPISNPPSDLNLQPEHAADNSHFPPLQSDQNSKASTSPSIDLRSTKKARVKEKQWDFFGGRTIASENSNPHPAPMSFKDKMLRGQRHRDCPMFETEDIEIEDLHQEVVLIKDGQMPWVVISDKVEALLAQPWENVVILKVMGNRLTYSALCNRLYTMWYYVDGFATMDLERGYVLAKFTKKEDMVDVLQKAPWLVGDSYLYIQQWDTSFDAATHVISSTTVWARLPGLPCGRVGHMEETCPFKGEKAPGIEVEDDSDDKPAWTSEVGASEMGMGGKGNNMANKPVKPDWIFAPKRGRPRSQRPQSVPSIVLIRCKQMGLDSTPCRIYMKKQKRFHRICQPFPNAIRVQSELDEGKHQAVIIKHPSTSKLDTMGMDCDDEVAVAELSGLESIVKEPPGGAIMMEVVQGSSEKVPPGVAFDDDCELGTMLLNCDKPQVVAVLEPRISGKDADTFIRRTKFDRSFRVKARGFSGGIWVDCVEVEVLACHSQYVHTKIIAGGKEMFVTIIYGSPNRLLRRALWDQLYERMEWPWLVGGDYNSILYDEESLGGSNSRNIVCLEFAEWLFDNQLHELPTDGIRFTWKRGNLERRLDRFICNEKWSDDFPGSLTIHLSKMRSDHNPLLVRLSSTKSKVIFSKSVEHDHGLSLAQSMGFEIVADLGVYLGMQLLHGRITKKTYGSILDKARKRLSGWAASTLSFARRVTLAQSVLTTLPYYAIQSSLLPVSLCDEMEKLCRRFIWGGGDNTRKLSLVPWKKVCEKKEFGGLGFRNQRQMNWAFILKLGWQIVTNKEALLTRVMRDKYGLEEGVGYQLPTKPKSSPCYKAIAKAWPIMFKACRWVVNDRQESLKMVGAIPVTREWRLLAWSPPPTEWIKLNTDGALNTNTGWATVGGLLRDCTGGWCGGFSMNIGYCSIAGAEIWGLLQGLQLAWDKGYRKLEAEVDNESVVRLVLAKEPNSGVHLEILHAIKELMSRSWEVKLAHVHREKNFAADYMAALAVSNPPGLHRMDFPPSRVRNWLFHIGVAHPINVIVSEL
ncbi:OLC1v1013568C1 [Oldenlandia corymbosa var. corymbosa]|uniref:OLC1v1013568C1 n=1 Tax=Oldenlandia corymbosa var. corymbosa TaxID=529605 RepID=A0AAV1E0P4_OLDCO|nr:OLC1v1013568C1 [Oldenlandia corymbosa var. corymbosa]